MRTREDRWIDTYRDMGALWIHDDNPTRPHALLTAGQHSNGFFNSGIVTEDTRLLSEACVDLLEALQEQGLDLESVDRVVGPAMGAITLAYELARHIGTLRGRTCFTACAEKGHDGITGKDYMDFKRIAFRRNERVLVVEDVITTGGSVGRTAEAVTRSGGIVLPYVATLVNRSGLAETDGRAIVALINRDLPAWEPEACPLCKLGSEAIRPKQDGNWKRLNAVFRCTETK